MIESVFKQVIQQGIIDQVLVEEKLPSKGKPAQKNLGSTTVYIVTFLFGEKVMTLKSARGGAREWASLTNLDKWLKECGVSKYSICHLSKDPLQQKFVFSAVREG